jgi:hypothetical protein
MAQPSERHAEVLKAALAFAAANLDELNGFFDRGEVALINVLGDEMFFIEEYELEDALEYYFGLKEAC